MAWKFTDNESGDYFRAQLGTDKGFLVTFSTIDTESAENGDFASIGWSDYDSCEPDEFDRADELTAVDLAVRYLRDKGATQPSSSFPHPGLWYSTGVEIEDYSTDEETEYNYHPTNFTDEEQRAIFDGMRR
jgi:hypothetical protein